jgi:cell division protein FtsW
MSTEALSSISSSWEKQIKKKEMMLDMKRSIGCQLSELILLLSILLTCFGLISIFASSSLKGTQVFSNEFYFFSKQLATSIIGFIFIGIILIIPFRIIERAALPSLIFALFLLLLIFIPGAYNKVGGASRWLNIPFVGGQPGELAKLSLVLFLSKNLSRSSNRISDFRSGVLPNLVILAMISGLLLVQKDLGTPVLLVLITLAMLIVAGLSWRYLGYLVFSGLLIISMAIIFEPYRIRRLTSYLDPWSEAQGQGFQIIQSFVAFTNGGLFGTGLGESKQKLFFLPEAHTDFIVSVIAEETGLIGIFTLIGAYILLTLICLKIIELQKNSFRQFLAFGLTVMLSFQVLFNIGVAMGLLPTKGMPLPFISAGSSSLLISLLASGILAKIARETPSSESPMQG